MMDAVRNYLLFGFGIAGILVGIAAYQDEDLSPVALVLLTLFWPFLLASAAIRVAYDMMKGRQQ